MDCALDVKWKKFDSKEYDRVQMQIHSEPRSRIDPNDGLFLPRKRAVGVYLADL